jgi:hypothetical protein
MENVSIINTVETVNVTMGKRLKHVRKSAKNDVAMASVVLWKPVTIVLMTVNHVTQPNIVGIISVIMEKPVIHVVRIVLNVPIHVEMGLVMPTKVKHVRHVRPIVEIVSIVGMEFVMEVKHVRIALVIVDNVIPQSIVVT